MMGATSFAKQIFELMCEIGIRHTPEGDSCLCYLSNLREKKNGESGQALRAPRSLLANVRGGLYYTTFAALVQVSVPRRDSGSDWRPEIER
jgi:hypothetical protein